MVKFDFMRTVALSFPETSEEPHFKKSSFRVKKKIFATYDENEHKACLKLSAIDQNVFASADSTSIYPVGNKWGKEGWTIFELTKVNADLFIDALTTAYCGVAPKTQSQEIRPKKKE